MIRFVVASPSLSDLNISLIIVPDRLPRSEKKEGRPLVNE
jgi:hypothetical protein